MTIAGLTLLAAVILIIASIAPGSREFDNANPRDPGFYRLGLRSRSHAAHQNGFETFPFFAAAVILAEMCHVPQGPLDVLAVSFILIRIIYVLL